MNYVIIVANNDNENDNDDYNDDGPEWHLF